MNLYRYTIHCWTVSRSIKRILLSLKIRCVGADFFLGLSFAFLGCEILKELHIW